MQKKFSVFLILSLFVVAVTTAWAHEKVKLTGYVVDVMCFADQLKAKPEDALKAAQDHDKECALMENCVKSGYGIYAEGKWYPFDAKGNDLAKAIFEKSKRNKEFKMTVEGMKHDGKILVATLTEAE
jgi:hypothetical protein